MGLNMYLEGKKYIGGKFNEISEQITINIKKNWSQETKSFTIETKDISEISIDLGYWRKANAIHKWFVDKCFSGKYDDYHGEEIYVRKEQLKELKDLCGNVLNKIQNAITFEEKKEVIDTLLPMQNGFFFGFDDSEDGIKWYIADIEDTIKTIDEALKKIKKYELDSIYYSASW